MNRNKLINKANGFSLIELVIALFIGTIISLSLYQTYNQIQKIVFIINNDIDIDTYIFPFYNQIEKDLTGSFVPIKYNLKDYINNKKDVVHSFQADTKNNLLNLNFITTNTLRFVKSELEEKYSIIPQPYFCRVNYNLIQDKLKANRYILIYSQTNDLSKKGLEDLKNAKKFEILSNIKKILFNFEIYELDKDKKPKLVTLNEFDPTEIAKKYKTLLPAFVNIKFTITDEFNTTEKEFAFRIKVYSYNLEKEQ